MTVAASRGVTGATLPPSTSRARAAKCDGSLIAARRPAGRSVIGRGGGVWASRDLYDQLDLDRRIERQRRRADRAAGMPAGLAEHFEQQLAGPVDDLRLPGETGVAGHEARHLDHMGHRGQPPATDATAANAFSAAVRARAAASAAV